MPKYKKLIIDGVEGDIYDDAAIHEDEVTSVVLNVLDSPTIRTALLNIYHPVGSYYFTDRNVNPGTFLGGTWTNVEGRVLLGASSKYPVGSTGGSEDAVVPEHTHNATGEIEAAGSHTHSVSGTAAWVGNHSHGLSSMFSGGSGGSYSRYVNENKRKDSTRYTDGAGGHSHTVSGTANAAGEHTHTAEISIAAAGESGSGKNMMPYIAAYIWVRTA